MTQDNSDWSLKGKETSWLEETQFDEEAPVFYKKDIEKLRQLLVFKFKNEELNEKEINRLFGVEE